MGYDGRVSNVMRDENLSEEDARSFIGRDAYNGQVSNVMRDENLSEEDARSFIGRDSYAATSIIAIMVFFCCSEKEAKSIFGKVGGEASGAARRVVDERVLCRIPDCKCLQNSLNNPFCRQCTQKNNQKRKLCKIVLIEKKHCLMCGRTEDDVAFATKDYCGVCYKKPEGKVHRKQVKKDTKVLCNEPGCDNIAYKGGKCQTCHNGY